MKKHFNKINSSSKEVDKKTIFIIDSKKGDLRIRVPNIISGLEFIKVSLNFFKLNAMILENHKIIHIHFQSRELTH